ncbi:MAG: hypothetical protein IPM91_02375 [Bacteroidetes bacterium]|nr:hypothetical protein [Bacteroidota bacterium]
MTKSIIEKVLKLINKDREYKEFYYYNAFKEKYHTSDHFNFKIDIKANKLEHSQNEIEGKSWSEYLSTVKGSLNILDQLFFKSLETEFKVIPFPILFSPGTLIVVPKSTVEEIDKIVAPIAESVHFYLFNRLLTELCNDLKLQSVLDRLDLIKEFINELKQVAIPIKYQIGNDKTCRLL